MEFFINLDEALQLLIHFWFIELCYCICLRLLSRDIWKKMEHTRKHWFKRIIKSQTINIPALANN